MTSIFQGKQKSNTWVSQLMNTLIGIYTLVNKKETQSWDWHSGKNKTFYSKALIENPIFHYLTQI